MKQPAEPLLLKTRDFVLILTEVALGLAYLHAARILDNDLKHDNVMVTTRNKHVTAKIIDFRCACHAEQPAQFKVPTGMSTHIAPEVAEGGAVTRLSDIYSYRRLVEDVEAVMRTGYPYLHQMSTAYIGPARTNKRPDLEAIIRLLDSAGVSILPSRNKYCGYSKVIVGNFADIGTYFGVAKCKELCN
uniref:Protein kinase domain-containing protein n=1 Tax=Branchiostoma floridae TaxID=7739 RepID=C3YY45_BRAFL|eukprot:XP_002598992.1 hypothetical protein BRAFLDRAFT_79925 [Branchiostoma floridae]